MSIRKIEHINPDGKVIAIRADIGERTIEERLTGLQEIAGRMGPDAKLLVPLSVICDGCGARIELQRPELPSDWVATPQGEFCPSCHRGTAA